MTRTRTIERPGGAARRVSRHPHEPGDALDDPRGGRPALEVVEVPDQVHGDERQQEHEDGGDPEQADPEAAPLGRRGRRCQDGRRRPSGRRPRRSRSRRPRRCWTSRPRGSNRRSRRRPPRGCRGSWRSPRSGRRRPRRWRRPRSPTRPPRARSRWPASSCTVRSSSAPSASTSKSVSSKMSFSALPRAGVAGFSADGPRRAAGAGLISEPLKGVSSIELGTAACRTRWRSPAG